MTPRRAPDGHRAHMRQREHARLWRLVEGAVVDALGTHPEFLTKAGRAWAVTSITKRVVGQLVGHAKQAQPRGRDGGSRGTAAGYGAAGGVGRYRPPRTRFPQLFAALCGDAQSEGQACRTR